MSKTNLCPSSSWILDDKKKQLRTKCNDLVLPLTNDEQELVDKMVAYIDASYDIKDEESDFRPGIAIASNQVGLLKPIIYIKFDDPDGLKNYLLGSPKIIKHSLQKCYLQSGEECLSVPKKHSGHILRHYKIVVDAIDLNTNKSIQIEAKGLFSICLQHEIDHLSGILYYDHIDSNNKYIDPKQSDAIAI